MLTTFLYGTIQALEKISYVVVILRNFQIRSSAVKRSKFGNFLENPHFLRSRTW